MIIWKHNMTLPKLEWPTCCIKVNSGTDVKNWPVEIELNAGLLNVCAYSLKVP